VPPFWLGVLAAVVAVSMTTLVVYPLKRVAADIYLSVVYLLAVLFIASYWDAWRSGRSPCRSSCSC
jgi:uncharacterized membrane protein YphA (DoxX/SURF4 family)